MKTYLYSLVLGFLLITGFNSCDKDEMPPAPKSKKEYLTSKTWIYYEYFTNYNASPTVLAYKKGKAGNTMNLSQNWVKFNTDGTYQEKTETGQTLSGTWKFLNNETQTEVINTQGTFTSTIIILDDEQYEWHDNVNGRYGRMIPN